MRTCGFQVIERREYKYLIDHRTAAAVRAAIQPFCRVDPHAAGNPGGAYTVETLYLDSPHLELFWANDHEQVDRVKVRVRGYAEARHSPVFFEVKRRTNDVISKTRGKVSRAVFARLIEDPSSPIPADISPRDWPHVERFLAIARMRRLHPVTLVRYRREPWVSQIDEYARVTFDTRIRASTTDCATFDPDNASWRALDTAINTRSAEQSMTVLELKFTTHVPTWMVHVVQSLGLARGAFSKYGTSIKAFYEPMGMRASAVGGCW